MNCGEDSVKNTSLFQSNKRNAAGDNERVKEHDGMDIESRDGCC